MAELIHFPEPEPLPEDKHMVAICPVCKQHFLLEGEWGYHYFLDSHGCKMPADSTILLTTLEKYLDMAEQGII